MSNTNRGAWTIEELDAWLKLNRERQAAYRQAKADRGECRECKNPAVIKNGKSMRLCVDHLERDRVRAEERARLRRAGRNPRP